VRPEHLFVHLEKDSGGFPAEVYVIEPQGNEVIFDLAVGSMILRARAETKNTQIRVRKRAFLLRYTRVEAR
jgi:hypothetical protein